MCRFHKLKVHRSRRKTQNWHSALWKCFLVDVNKMKNLHKWMDSLFVSAARMIPYPVLSCGPSPRWSDRRFKLRVPSLIFRTYRTGRFLRRRTRGCDNFLSVDEVTTVKITTEESVTTVESPIRMKSIIAMVNIKILLSAQLSKHTNK